MKLRKYHIDFETRSCCDIEKYGAWNYSLDPTTEVLCMAAYDPSVAEIELMTTNEEIMQFMQEIIDDEDGVIVAHNVSFEYSIWHNIFVKRYGAPSIPLTRWRCTMAKASACGLPRSLGVCSIELGLPHQKDNAGRLNMLKMCKPVSVSLFDGVTWYDTQEAREKLYAYCKQDVLTEKAIDERLPDLSADEQIVWMMDQRMNIDGFLVDRQMAKEAITIANRNALKANQTLVTTTSGAVQKVTEIQKLTAWVRKQLPNETIDGLDKEQLDRLLGLDIPAHVRAALEARYSDGLASVSKFEAFLDYSDGDGAVHHSLVYHGAQPGKWSGAGVQPQNLPRGQFEGDFDELCNRVKNGNDVTSRELSATVRGLIIARPNRKFLIADYNAIEARGVLWLAGAEKGLEGFRSQDRGEGLDFYVSMARRIFQNGELSKQNKKERQVGKAAVLGCGYGMGQAKFKASAKSEYGVDVSEQIAQTAVETYRSQFPEVVAFWSQIEQAAISGLAKETQCRYLTYYPEKDFLCCRMPSGRVIRYFKPFLKVGQYGRKELCYWKTKNGMMYEEGTFGGKLTENAVTAISSDILRFAMLNLWKRDYRAVLTIHDEIICETTKDKTIEEQINIMSEVPTWAKGFPIKVEGFETQRYRK